MVQNNIGACAWYKCISLNFKDMVSIQILICSIFPSGGNYNPSYRPGAYPNYNTGYYPNYNYNGFNTNTNNGYYPNYNTGFGTGNGGYGGFGGM